MLLVVMLVVVARRWTAMLFAGWLSEAIGDSAMSSLLNNMFSIQHV